MFRLEGEGRAEQLKPAIEGRTELLLISSEEEETDCATPTTTSKGLITPTMEQPLDEYAEIPVGPPLSSLSPPVEQYDDNAAQTTDSGPTSHRLFITKLPFEVTAEDLRVYFEQYGRVSDAYVPRNPYKTYMNKGFGFVSFSAPQYVERVLAQPFHVIRNRQVVIDRATQRKTGECENGSVTGLYDDRWGENGGGSAPSGSRKGDDPSTAGIYRPATEYAFGLPPSIMRYPRSPPKAVFGPRVRMPPPLSPSHNASKAKLFIGRLSYSTTAEALRRYFEKYGEVSDAYVPKEPTSGRSRGFGFLTFADASAVEKVFRDGPHEVDGRQVAIDQADPAVRSYAPTRHPAEEGIMHPELGYPPGGPGRRPNYPMYPEEMYGQQPSRDYKGDPHALWRMSPHHMAAASMGAQAMAARRRPMHMVYPGSVPVDAAMFGLPFDVTGGGQPLSRGQGVECPAAHQAKHRAEQPQSSRLLHQAS